MPLYQYEDTETHELVELFEDADKTTSIGRTKRWKGRTLRRVLPRLQPPVMGEFEVTAWSQRPNTPGAQHYNEDGAPVLHGKKQVNEFLETQRKMVDKDGQGDTMGEYLAFDGHERL